MANCNWWARGKENFKGGCNHELMKIRFPKPLQPGDIIAVTAPSSGVEEALVGRLEFTIQHLRNVDTSRPSYQ